jgi:hypothetical protein
LQITLFLLMLGTGLPELQDAKDVGYLRDRLLLNMSDKGGVRGMDAGGGRLQENNF